MSDKLLTTIVEFFKVKILWSRRQWISRIRMISITKSKVSILKIRLLQELLNNSDPEIFQKRGQKSFFFWSYVNKYGHFLFKPAQKPGYNRVNLPLDIASTLSGLVVFPNPPISSMSSDESVSLSFPFE